MERLTITKDILLALKTADIVSFRLSEKNQTGHIEVEANIKNKGFEARARQTFATFANVTVCRRRYDDKPMERATHYHKAVFILQYAKQEGSWRALLNLLRVGDSIELSVLGNNNSPAMWESGISAHELKACIFRNGQSVVIDMLLSYAVESNGNPFSSVSIDCPREPVAA